MGMPKLRGAEAAVGGKTKEHVDAGNLHVLPWIFSSPR